MSQLQLDKVYKNYGNKQILKNISFSLKKGEIVGMLGKNGAGKSSLIRLITGLTKADRGSIKVFGRDPWIEREYLFGKLGCLIDPAFPNYLTGAENIKLLAMLHNIPKNQYEEKINEVNLWEARNKKVKDYSFGMKQRLGLAQAMLTSPNLLILDEPTVGMDPIGVKYFLEKLKDLQKEGVTILFSSHQLQEIESLCSRVLLIDDGELILDKDIQSATKTVGVKIMTNNNNAAFQVLKDNDFTSMEIAGDAIFFESFDSHHSLNDVVKLLIHHDIEIVNIDKKSSQLGALFEKEGRELRVEVNKA